MLMEFGDIIQDIVNDTNLDIDFSYEDGLRLSELMGQAQDLQFRIDNYQMFTWGDHGVFILIGALISLIVMVLVVFWVADTPCFDRLAMRRRLRKDPHGHAYVTGADKDMGDWYAACFFWGMLALCIVGTAILAIVGGDMLHAHTVMGWQAELANCNGQIEALLAKYGVTI